MTCRRSRPCSGARPVRRHLARGPRRRRARVAARDGARAPLAGEGRRSCSSADQRLFQGSTASSSSPTGACIASCRPTRGSACSSPSTARARARVVREPGLVERAPFTINIDHHHDNPRFGDVNLIVADASSTGEVLADVFRELGVELTPGDRGGAVHRARHRHRSLPVREHDAEGAASRRRLVEAGADVHRVFQGGVRERPVREAEAARTRARSGAGARGRRDRVSHLLRDDFEAVGATEPYSEGIIDCSAPSRARSSRRSSASRRGKAARASEGLAPLIGRRGGRERDRTQVAAEAGTARPRGSRASSR